MVKLMSSKKTTYFSYFIKKHIVEVKKNFLLITDNMEVMCYLTKDFFYTSFGLKFISSKQFVLVSGCLSHISYVTILKQIRITSERG